MNTCSSTLEKSWRQDRGCCVNPRITQQCLLVSWANTLVSCLKQMQVTFSGPTCADKTVELPSVLNLSLKSKQGCSSLSKEMLTGKNMCSIKKPSSHRTLFTNAFCLIAFLINYLAKIAILISIGIYLKD